jgi:hypothetical protein
VAVAHGDDDHVPELGIVMYSTDVSVARDSGRGTLYGSVE